MTRGLLAAFVAAVTLLAGSRARAQGVGETCAASYEHAQQLVRDRALRRARAELRQCVSSCPATLARDCQSWSEQVERDMPSVALSATSADGHAPGRVRVLLDGAPLVEALPKDPIELDPGRHTLTFEDAAGTRVVTVVTVSPGDKALPIAVRFPAAAPPAAARGGAAPVRQRWPLVLAGVGAVAVGVGAFLGIKGHVDRSELRSRCAPGCTADEVEAIDTLWTAGAISAGAGLVVAGVGTVLYFQLDPMIPAAPSTGSALLPDGAGLSLRGAF
ncbi:hypothetical protein [Sorangium cellulosum]|uniref:PEGA domain-containing protein n=1 Tax=Sorangium cellulosum So0157-2 TaxID=1254432 RepID=S4Y192_SORCE|nr:hypothetical protein [Sorangium cellulosum]AGP36683.1 hypothetical protein SCE1572_20610 [Sorangium cellulosum So0157-2]